jgi:hypothetical protein
MCCAATVWQATGCFTLRCRFEAIREPLSSAVGSAVAFCYGTWPLLHERSLRPTGHSVEPPGIRTPPHSRKFVGTSENNPTGLEPSLTIEPMGNCRKIPITPTTPASGMLSAFPGTPESVKSSRPILDTFPHLVVRRFRELSKGEGVHGTRRRISAFDTRKKSEESE